MGMSTLNLADGPAANTEVVVIFLLLLIFLVLIFISWLVARATKALELAANAQHRIADNQGRGSGPRTGM